VSQYGNDSVQLRRQTLTAGIEMSFETISECAVLDRAASRFERLFHGYRASRMRMKFWELIELLSRHHDLDRVLHGPLSKTFGELRIFTGWIQYLSVIRFIWLVNVSY